MEGGEEEEEEDPLTGLREGLGGTGGLGVGGPAEDLAGAGLAADQPAEVGQQHGLALLVVSGGTARRREHNTRRMTL